MPRRIGILVSGAVAAGASAVAGLWAVRGRRRRQRAERQAARAARVGHAPAAEEASVPEASATPAPSDVAPDASGDALQAIRGIGAVSAARLRDIGVTTWAHIAAWSDEEAREMATRIKVSPDRVAREAWVAQAQELVSAAREG